MVEDVATAPDGEATDRGSDASGWADAADLDATQPDAPLADAPLADSAEEDAAPARDALAADGEADAAPLPDALPDDVSFQDAALPDAPSADAVASDLESTADAGTLIMLDCLDGIDVDNDGLFDEDAGACVSPPVVTCPEFFIQTVGYGQTFVASSTDTGLLVERHWSVASSPAGGWIELVPSDPETIVATPYREGSYVLRYTAINDRGEATACETPIDAVLPPGCDRPWPYPTGIYAGTATVTNCLDDLTMQCAPSCSTSTMAALLSFDAQGSYPTATLTTGVARWEVSRFPAPTDDGSALTFRSFLVTCPRSFTIPNPTFQARIGRDGTVQIEAYCFESAPDMTCGSVVLHANGAFRCVANDDVCRDGRALLCDSDGNLAMSIDCGRPCP